MEVLSYHNAASLEEVAGEILKLLKFYLNILYFIYQLVSNCYFGENLNQSFKSIKVYLLLLLQVDEILTAKDTDEPIEEIAS